MPKKDLTLSSKILIDLLKTGDVLFLTPREIKKRGLRGEIFGNYSRSKAIIYYLIKKGLIKIVNKNNERFIKLTSHGELEALLSKAKINIKENIWDGKWRLVIFDIPEESRDKRSLLRQLLKKNHFQQLQASVFISPYALNREAIDYLNKTKLTDYIRILKVEEMDDDKDLKKIFQLK